MTEVLLLSIAQASEMSGIKPQKLHREIRKGNLKAAKMGWIWIINQEDMLSYLANQVEINN